MIVNNRYQEDGLHNQLEEEEAKAFAGGLAQHGKSSGVSDYFAMVGPRGADEAIGYYVEEPFSAVQKAQRGTD